MTLEINNNDFHTVNEFDNSFEFIHSLHTSAPETMCPILDKICKDLKTNLLSKGTSANIDNTTLLYRARKVCAKDLSYEEDNNEELSFWKDYLKSYFNNSKDEKLQKKFIQKQAFDGKSINEEISKALSSDYLGFNKDKSGAPPIDKSKNDRASKTGERVLYLSESIKTCLLECNANREEIFSIGEFTATKPLKIYDFPESENDYCKLWLSCIFSQVTQEKKYLKSQTLTRLIREMGYDGVKYRSAKNTEGFCYAIFNPEDFDCKRSYLVKPTNISISFRK